MGIVLETGSSVSLLKKGDRVMMPFNVADGRCRNCEGRTAFCTGVNPYFLLFLPPFIPLSSVHFAHVLNAVVSLEETTAT